LLTLAHALGIAPQVDFLGRISRDRVREEMYSADAFVLSSRSETFGVVLIEALSQGLPVVSTACGGPLDVVGEDDGILVPVDDVNALADGLRCMREMAGAFDRTRLIQRCQARYSASAVSRVYANWYAHARKTAEQGAQP
jgi:glycosyltransferase involved in cell wall biosynthesis